jgi:hypothetical protein
MASFWLLLALFAILTNAATSIDHLLSNYDSMLRPQIA